jgi:hypothetical protein
VTFSFTFQTKAYREYVGSKKNVSLLTEEDKFLLQLGKVERISAKLSIMSYIGNFFDNLHLITPVSIKHLVLYPLSVVTYLLHEAECTLIS